jgi:hypothetical protein
MINLPVISAFQTSSLQPRRRAGGQIGVHVIDYTRVIG